MMGIGAALGAATSIAQMATQKAAERRQQGYQKELMGIQHQNQRSLNEQGNDLQYDMWQKTNFQGQMEQAKLAGLNPALLYGGSAGGGTTTGSQTGGSAQAGNAPQAKGMDISQISQMAQLDLLKAQKENIDADTRNKEESAGETHEKGKGQYYENIIKEFEMGDRDENESQVYKHDKYGQGGVSKTSPIAKKLKAEVTNMSSTASIQEIEAKIREATQHNDTSGRIAEAMGHKIKNSLMEADINLKSEQARKLYHDIILNYINAGMKGLDAITKGIIKKGGKMK